MAEKNEGWKTKPSMTQTSKPCFQTTCTKNIGTILSDEQQGLELLSAKSPKNKICTLLTFLKKCSIKPRISHKQSNISYNRLFDSLYLTLEKKN